MVKTHWRNRADYRISWHMPASRGSLLKASRSVWSRGGQDTRSWGRQSICWEPQVLKLFPFVREMPKVGVYLKKLIIFRVACGLGGGLSQAKAPGRAHRLHWLEQNQVAFALVSIWCLFFILVFNSVFNSVLIWF